MVGLGVSNHSLCCSLQCMLFSSLIIIFCAYLSTLCLMVHCKSLEVENRKIGLLPESSSFAFVTVGCLLYSEVRGPVLSDCHWLPSQGAYRTGTHSHFSYSSCCPTKSVTYFTFTSLVNVQIFCMPSFPHTPAPKSTDLFILPKTNFDPYLPIYSYYGDGKMVGSLWVSLLYHIFPWKQC